MSWRDNLLAGRLKCAIEKSRDKLNKELKFHMEKIADQMFLKARTEAGCYSGWGESERLRYFWEQGIQTAFEIFEDSKFISRLEEVKELGLDDELEALYPTIQAEITQSAQEKSLDKNAIRRQYFNAGFVHAWKRMKKYYAKIKR